MLAILTTHPIQYQVPLWQLLAREGTVPFEVWYLTDHATRPSKDREFGQTFAWDLNMLEGYPHRFLTTAPDATPNAFWDCRVKESLPKLFQETGTKVLWVQGWQVAAYWQAVWAAERAGVEVWLRAESNALKPVLAWKRVIKRLLLGAFFRRIDHFLCIGTANRELYRSYGVPESKLHDAPYAVANERFAKQAEAIRGERAEIRREWGIAENAFCVLFCGKFIPKKRPMDLVRAAQLLMTNNSLTNNQFPNLHLLFVGSGELGEQLRMNCNVVFDAEASSNSDLPSPSNQEHIPNNRNPRASFAGFLNQTEISQAYVAADCLVLPSDHGETWGLVVNEAMASELHCIISDQCGCAEDLGAKGSNAVFRCGEISNLADKILSMVATGNQRGRQAELPSLSTTVATVAALYV